MLLGVVADVWCVDVAVWVGRHVIEESRLLDGCLLVMLVLLLLLSHR